MGFVFRTHVDEIIMFEPADGFYRLILYLLKSYKICIKEIWDILFIYLTDRLKLCLSVFVK